MPTQPNANSPFLPARLQAELGVRAPGTPTMAGSPGVQAGSAMSFPAPPAPAAGIPGRPPGPKAQAPVATTSATAPTAQPRAQAQAQQGAGAGAAASTPVGPAPMGTPSPDGGLTLSPEGDMRYRQAVLAGREALGPIPRLFRHASLPELPFELGRSNYNPFTGSWSEASEGGGQ